MKHLFISLSYICIIVLGLVLLLPQPTHAGPGGNPTGGTIDLTPTGGLGGCSDINCVVDNFVSALLLVGFPVATLFIIIGGVQIATAGGSQERVQRGKKTITYAAVGLFIIMIASSVQAIIQSLL